MGLQRITTEPKRADTISDIDRLRHLAFCDEVIREDVGQLVEGGIATMLLRAAETQEKPLALNEYFQGLHLRCSTYLRTGDRILLGYNSMASKYNALELSMLGKRMRSLPVGSSRHLDESTEQSLLGGASLLCFEHEATALSGRLFRWSTLKVRLSGTHDGGFYLLNLARPIELLEGAAQPPGRLLAEQLAMYQQLDDVDRRICQGIAVGDLTSEMAVTVGLTRRSIEVRRAKILEHFGFSRKVQIVRLLVRLEENGLLPD